MSVIQWWLTYYVTAAFEPRSEHLIPTRQMLYRFINSKNSRIFLKLLSSSDLLRRNYI